MRTHHPVKFDLKRKYLPFLIAVAVLWLFNACAFFSDLIGQRPTSIPIGDYSYTIEYIEKQIERHMRRFDLPSVLIAMIDDQNVVWHKAFGFADVENNVPATLDSVYKIGSITKVFAGIEIMRLYEDGLLDLDAPLTMYLPDFTIKSNPVYSDPGYLNSITTRSILAHRSGLPRNSAFLGWYWEVIPDVLKNQTESVADLYQAFPVGYRYKYSNIGYNILGRLIEVLREVEPPASNAPGALPYYMKESFLDPIGMTDTGFGSRALLYGETDVQDVAVGYYTESGQNVRNNQFDFIGLASGNMQSTIKDLELFVQFILRGGSTPEGQIIGEDTLALMFEEQYTRPRDPQTNGLTWFTDSVQLSERMVFHSGTNQGFISLISMVPEKKIGVVLLSNSDRFEEIYNQLSVEVLELMLETKYGTAPLQKTDPAIVSVDESVLKTYEGNYIVNGEIIEVSLRIGGLKAMYGGATVNLNPISPTQFSLSHWLTDVGDMTMEFFVDDSEDDDIMIVTLGGSFYIISPRYPEIDAIPDFWQDFTGAYTILARYPSVYSENEIGSVDISIVDGILQTSSKLILLPISETEIRIVGGIYDGEIMIFDKSDRTITWQNLIYRDPL